MTLTAIKAEARKIAFVTRKAAFAAGQGQAAELLADFLGAQSGKVLSGYMPMRTEIDPLPAMVAHQGPVCVPVIVGKDMPLRFREWSPGCAMRVGAFGALIPDEGAWLEPQVLIVPLLSYDRRGYRLGYGGGFYDRTLATLQPRPVTVGLGFTHGWLPDLEPEAHDIPLDALLNDNGVVWPV